MRKIILTLIMCLCFGFVYAEIDKTKTYFTSECINLRAINVDKISLGCKCWFEINCVADGNSTEEFICFDISSCIDDRLQIIYDKCVLKIFNKNKNVTDSLKIAKINGGIDYQKNGVSVTKEHHVIVRFVLKNFSCIDGKKCIYIPSEKNGFIIYLEEKQDMLKTQYYKTYKEYKATKKLRDNEISVVKDIID